MLAAVAARARKAAVLFTTIRMRSRKKALVQQRRIQKITRQDGKVGAGCEWEPDVPARIFSFKIT